MNNIKEYIMILEEVSPESTYTSGWFNYKTNKFIKHPRYQSHVYAAIKHPEMYDISPTNDRVINDGDREFIQTMNAIGWIRIILDGSELNIQAEDINAVRKTVSWFIKQGYIFKEIYYDLNGDHRNSGWIYDKDIIRFAKTGNLPKIPTFESAYDFYDRDYDYEDFIPPETSLPYGYWITNIGEIITVDEYQGHSTHTPQGTVKALHDGWMRVVIEENEDTSVSLMIEVYKSKVLAKVLYGFAKLCSEIERERFVSYIMIERTTDSLSTVDMGEFRDDGCIRKATSWLRSRM